MRKPIVAGNWKMNGNSAFISELMQVVVTEVGGEANVEVLVCPVAVYLAQVKAEIGSSLIGLGAQNASEHPHGAYTGEIAPEMLRDLGCRYVIVGHSERRALYAETDALVADKFAAAIDAGLVPILCVGETLAERESGETLAVVSRQLKAVLARVGVAAFNRAVVAYEPVWAIGTGRTATPQQAQEVHAAIRGVIAECDAAVAAGLRILYGGSVSAANAAELFAEADVDGGLVGGASLKAQDFIAICRAAAGV